MTEPSKAEQELREKIEETIFDWQFRAKITSSLASRILALIKEAGYVQLADDQSFPAFVAIGGCSQEELIQEMRDADWKAGWRKVILEVKK